MDIRLLVIRTENPENLANFYRLLGLSFEYHKHGKSPYHYSALIGQTVLEIYPLAKGQAAADKNLRIGFGINNFEKTIEKLRAQGVTFLTEPTQTEFGYLTVIVDPDERRIELYAK